MSATVTYKGSTLTTVDGQTVTLDTGGKWLEDDIAITDVTQSGPTPTEHTIYFEFSDDSDATLTGYWNDAFISDAIRATSPETYGGKTVNSASLDNSEWYRIPDFATIYDGVPTFYTDGGNYVWIPELGNIYPSVGSEWRITINNTEYLCVAQLVGVDVIVGNPVHVGGSDDETGMPFAFYNYQGRAWSGDTVTQQQGDYNIKIERKGAA